LKAKANELADEVARLKAESSEAQERAKKCRLDAKSREKDLHQRLQASLDGLHGEYAAELDAGAMKEPAGLESSVSTAERLCQEVGDLLAKVRSTLARVWDMSISDSTSDTMARILEALAVKPNGEDPLIAAVRR
jgi:hypothetical protein